jgi:AraC-like DNA-binding protein
MTSPSAHAETVPVVHLNDQEIPREHLFEAWHQAADPMFDVLPVQDPETYSCASTFYQVEQLMFCNTSFEGMQFVRPPQKLSGSESDCITVQYYATGQIRGSLQDGTPLVMQPNCISVQDFAHAYSGFGETTNNFGVIIPRHLIAVHDEIYKNYPMFSWEITSIRGRLLLHTLNTLWQQLPHLPQAEASAAAAGFVGLLNGLLTSQWNEATRVQVEQAILNAMCSYINANLHRPELGVDQICQTFQCSRATLYRIFKPLEGVKRFIRKQRLSHCFHDLQGLGSTSTQRISDIASRWGVTNMSYFYRQFKDQFGITPSETRDFFSSNSEQVIAHSNSQYSDVKKVRHWLEQY